MNADFLFFRAVEDEGAMPCSAEYFVGPLVQKDGRKDNKGAAKSQKLTNDEADRHDRFSESHFVGDKAAASERIRRVFVANAPLNSLQLMRFEVDSSVGEETAIVDLNSVGHGEKLKS